MFIPLEHDGWAYVLNQMPAVNDNDKELADKLEALDSAFQAVYDYENKVSEVISSFKDIIKEMQIVLEKVKEI